MKSHELAKTLLGMPNLDIRISKWNEGNTVYAEEVEILYGCKCPPEKENNDEFVEADEWIPVNDIFIRERLSS